MMNIDLSFYSWELVKSYVLSGFLFSIQLTIIATVGGIFFGTLLALMRLSGKSFLEIPASIYVNMMRSIPLVMVILWFFLLMPSILGRPIGAEASAIITFIAFESAFFCEIMRSGIQSIPRGQIYAGQAMGMTYSQNMRLVILPQAFRKVLPPLLNDLVSLQKDSGLISVLGAIDAIRAAGIETAQSFNFTPYLVAGFFFVLLTIPLTRYTDWLAKRQDIARQQQGEW